MGAQESMMEAGAVTTAAPWLYRSLLRLLARGARVSIDDLVAATGRPLAEVRDHLAGLADLETDNRGRIVGYWLTCVPTVHRFEVNGKLLYTWCVLDTLAFPSVIGEAASVESPCHATGAPECVSVDPEEGVTDVEPARAVVSVVERCAAPSVRESFCNHVHFFASEEAARPWLADHPGAQILPVGDAQELSRSLVDARSRIFATPIAAADHRHTATEVLVARDDRSIAGPSTSGSRFAFWKAGGAEQGVDAILAVIEVHAGETQLQAVAGEPGHGDRQPRRGTARRVSRPWLCGPADPGSRSCAAPRVSGIALDEAERECLADGKARARRRGREEARRADQDLAFEAAMATEIVRLFPGCPATRAEAIAHHAIARGSGRVGLSAAGRALDPRAVTLAVAASLRHEDTDYDELLMAGVARTAAREQVGAEVQRILGSWQAPEPS